MVRLPKYKGEEIILRHIKELVNFFEQTVFKVSDIASIGGTQRILVIENSFFNDIQYVIEILKGFEEYGFIKFINYNELKSKSNEFEVLIDNIGEMKPFRTHNDILNEMHRLSMDYLGSDYPDVREHIMNAERILYDPEKGDYSEVGHYCQLAYEDFLELACKKLGIDTQNLGKKNLTNNRFNQIVVKLKELGVSGTELKLLEALGNFRGCSSDFNEKVEHRNAEGNSTFIEAKKSFLYTFLVINEIHLFIMRNSATTSSAAAKHAQ